MIAAGLDKQNVSQALRSREWHTHAIQPCAFMASDIQKPNIVKLVHVRRSTGVTSISILLHVSLSPNDVGSCLSIHPDLLVFAFKLTLAASKR